MVVTTCHLVPSLAGPSRSSCQFRLSVALYQNQAFVGLGTHLAMQNLHPILIHYHCSKATNVENGVMPSSSDSSSRGAPLRLRSVVEHCCRCLPRPASLTAYLRHRRRFFKEVNKCDNSEKRLLLDIKHCFDYAFRRMTFSV